MKSTPKLIGWKAVLVFLDNYGDPAGTSEVSKALRINQSNAWTLLERCRMFGTVRFAGFKEVSEGSKPQRLYEITPLGSSRVENHFKRKEKG